MKASFLCILLTVSAAFAAAQNFEFGLNAGMGFNTAPLISQPYIIVNAAAKAPTASFAGLAKIACNYKNWRFGIEADYLNLSYKASGMYYVVTGNGKFEELPGPASTATLGNPAIPVKLFADRKIVFKRTEVYGGIAAGYVLLSHAAIPPAESYLFPVPLPLDHGKGYTIGLQAGGTYYLHKRIGINAEVQGNYMPLAIGSLKFKLYDFPATAGIRYRF